MSLQEKMAMAYQLGASQAIKTAAPTQQFQQDFQQMRNDEGARRRTRGAMRLGGAAGLGYGVYHGLQPSKAFSSAREALHWSPFLPNYEYPVKDLIRHAEAGPQRAGTAMRRSLSQSARSMPTRAMQHIKGIGTAYGSGGIRNALTHMGGSPLAKGLGAAAAVGLGYKGLSGIGNWMQGD